mgnify:CR=1 FL=1
MKGFEELLAQFRGIPRRYASEPKERAQAVDKLLDQITERYQIAAPRIEVEIIQNWRKIVGAEQAHRCKPSRISKSGELVITTTNPTLRMELQFKQREILKRIHNLIGSDQIQSVSIR